MLSPARMRTRMSAVLLLAVASFGLVATAATPAQAMTTYQYSVLHEAARHKGQPYVYGAAGPTRFDCSGFTLYVFKRFGRSLPHSSARQYSVVHHIAKGSKRVGDLIFFRNSSGRAELVTAGQRTLAARFFDNAKPRRGGSRRKCRLRADNRLLQPDPRPINPVE